MPSKKIKNKKLNIKKTAPKVASARVKKIVVRKTLNKKPATAESRKRSETQSLRLSVYDTKGKAVESLTLPKEIFGVEVNTNLMSQAVRVYLANQRRGTVKTKSRGEVNISTRKIYRQKGTGRARHGAASAPIFVGGGIAFGPRQRDYSLKLSQKMRKAALFSALSAKLKAGEIKIVTGLEKLEPKTKNFADAMKNLSLNEKKPQILLITPKSGSDFATITKGARNLAGVKITSSNLLNTYDVLSYRNILFMKDSIEIIKETFLKEK